MVLVARLSLMARMALKTFSGIGRCFDTSTNTWRYSFETGKTVVRVPAEVNGVADHLYHN